MQNGFWLAKAGLLRCWWWWEVRGGERNLCTRNEKIWQKQSWYIFLFYKTCQFVDIVVAKQRLKGVSDDAVTIRLDFSSRVGHKRFQSFLNRSAGFEVSLGNGIFIGSTFFGFSFIRNWRWWSNRIATKTIETNWREAKKNFAIRWRSNLAEVLLCYSASMHYHRARIMRKKWHYNFFFFSNFSSTPTVHTPCRNSIGPPLSSIAFKSPGTIFFLCCFLPKGLLWYFALDLLDLGSDDDWVALPDLLGTELLVVEVALVLITVPV